MFNQKTGFYNTIEEYRTAETELHTELMAVSRKYIHKLGIVSLIGVIDIVKQEVRELEHATNKSLDDEPQHQEFNSDIEKKEQSFF